MCADARLGEVGSSRLWRRLLSVLLAMALLVGLGAASSAADELPADPPDVVEISDECVYAAAPSGQNSNRVRIVLAPGHTYDVSVDDVAVQPNGGGAFDTTDASDATTFFYDIPVASASQPNTVVISHESTQLLESTISSGDCYQKATSLTISRSSSLQLQHQAHQHRIAKLPGTGPRH